MCFIQVCSTQGLGLGGDSSESDFLEVPLEGFRLLGQPLTHGFVVHSEPGGGTKNGTTLRVGRWWTWKSLFSYPPVVRSQGSG
jgi:hypothetical protein